MRYKKRRFIGKRQRSTYTTQSGTGHAGILYQRRKKNIRLVRNQLYRDTQYKTHYRCYFTVAGAANTAASQTNMQISFVNPFNNGSDFWTAAGGAQIVDSAGIVPLFLDDLVIRGGKWSYQYTNTDPSRTIRVRIWYIFTNSRPDTSIIPTSVQTGWDPSVIPDFNSKYGKVLWHENVILTPGQSWNYEERVKVQRIDQDVYHLLGRLPIFLFGLENMTDAVNASGTAKHTLNISFSGDSAGTA